MIRPIGEIFEFNGVKLEVREEFSYCSGCYFDKFDLKCKDNRDEIGECCNLRRGECGVIFKEVK